MADESDEYWRLLPARGRAPSDGGNLTFKCQWKIQRWTRERPGVPVAAARIVRARALQWAGHRPESSWPAGPGPEFRELAAAEQSRRRCMWPRCPFLKSLISSFKVRPIISSVHPSHEWRPVCVGLSSQLCHCLPAWGRQCLLLPSDQVGCGVTVPVVQIQWRTYSAGRCP